MKYILMVDKKKAGKEPGTFITQKAGAVIEADEHPGAGWREYKEDAGRQPLAGDSALPETNDKKEKKGGKK